MKKYPKIIFISENTASVGHRFRVMHTADALEANGYRTETYDLKDITDSFLLPECDMLVIFRSAWNHHLNRIVNVCKGKEIPVIFDIDDLFFMQIYSTTDTGHITTNYQRRPDIYGCLKLMATGKLWSDVMPPCFQLNR
jgi:hypothetical protein